MWRPVAQRGRDGQVLHVPNQCETRSADSGRRRPAHHTGIIGVSLPGAGPCAGQTSPGQEDRQLGRLSVSAGVKSMLELEDIQGGVLRPRPSPYAGAYVLISIDDCRAGREMLRRLAPAIASASHPTSPAGDAWVSIAFTFHGLKAMGLPRESLDSFPPEFQQGMAARAEEIGDVGENSPENWEKPFGSPDVHIALAAIAPDEDRLQSVLDRAQERYHAPGIEVIYRLRCHVNDTEREPFGFRDSIGQPEIEGSGIPGTNPKERPLKAGEFVFGYPDETGSLPPMPHPEALGRNGTFVVFRKLHQRVAEFRRYLRAKASNPDEEELL